MNYNLYNLMFIGELLIYVYIYTHFIIIIDPHLSRNHGEHGIFVSPIQLPGQGRWISKRLPFQGWLNSLHDTRALGIAYLVGGLEHEFHFSYVGNVIIPTDELIFFRGVQTTNQIYSELVSFGFNCSIVATSMVISCRLQCLYSTIWL